MNNKFALVLILALTFSIGAIARAQETPPLPLPVDSSTVTDSATDTVTSYVATPTRTVVSSQQAVDNADTGTEVVFLVGISVLGGIGLFLIKRYFDLKRLSL